MTRRESAKALLRLTAVPGLFEALALAGCSSDEHPGLDDPASVEGLKARMKRTKAPDPYDPVKAKARPRPRREGR
jgi:hypothetical protein